MRSSAINACRRECSFVATLKARQASKISDMFLGQGVMVFLKQRVRSVIHKTLIYISLLMNYAKIALRMRVYWFTERTQNEDSEDRGEAHRLRVKYLVAHTRKR